MKKRFKYLFFIFILCILAAFLLSSDIFQIKNIHVYGSKNLPKEEVLRLSNISQGQNIFRMDKKGAMKGIFQSPYVKLIKIKRNIPSTVIINIVEREPSALIPYVGSYLKIDEEGMILEIKGNVGKEALPIINGLKFDKFKIGDYLDIKNKEQLGITMKVIKEVKSAGLVSRIAEIDVSDTLSLKLRTKTGIKVNLGTDNKIDYKIACLQQILGELKNQKGTIEMGHKGDPVFMPE